MNYNTLLYNDAYCFLCAYLISATLQIIEITPTWNLALVFNQITTCAKLFFQSFMNKIRDTNSPREHLRVFDCCWLNYRKVCQFYIFILAKRHNSHALTMGRNHSIDWPVCVQRCSEPKRRQRRHFIGRQCLYITIWENYSSNKFVNSQLLTWLQK